jgi:AraC-like DNA-binding protein
MELALEWARPAPALRAYARRYVGFFERTSQPLRRRELPSGDVHLILSFGPTWDLPLHGGRHDSFVAGLGDRHDYSEHAGYAYGIEVQFTPLGARAFLGLPMRELTGLVAPLDAVSGRATQELVERLALAPTWGARFDLLDAAIAARAAATPPPPREVAWAWGRLAAADGRVAVGALAGELGWSRKRLIARFREHVGVAPKLYARLLRFQAAVEVLKTAPPDVRFGEVALDCGYYDQAHLNRDFRAFAGATPSAFVAARLPDQAGFAEGNSVQDAAGLAA